MKETPNNPKKVLSQIESVPEGRYPTETMVGEIFKRIPKRYLVTRKTIQHYR